jgi:hypothetical protein
MTTNTGYELVIANMIEARKAGVTPLKLRRARVPVPSMGYGPALLHLLEARNTPDLAQAA